MRKIQSIFVLFFTLYFVPCKAQSDQELNRDSVIGWQYISNPINPKIIYKPIKSQYAHGAVDSVKHQQA
ncbi:hypothetical protein, partial [Pedobacter sp. ASV12]|uniref:hypothetical protein n=1 Tax=Pedobacter sp. ASV12 TaxID=2795120 RepID=UPI001E5477B7